MSLVLAAFAFGVGTQSVLDASWIRFLANRMPDAAKLDALIGRDEVAGHALVYGELLIGGQGGRAKLCVLPASLRNSLVASDYDAGVRLASVSR